MSASEGTPRLFVVVYRESDRLLAEAFDVDSVPVLACAEVTPAGPMDPDCRGGKHKACAGSAWDDQADELTACTCPCHQEADRG